MSDKKVFKATWYEIREVSVNVEADANASDEDIRQMVAMNEGCLAETYKDEFYGSMKEHWDNPALIKMHVSELDEDNE